MSTSTTTDSQLKKGYKQTDIGIIPNDWPIVTLGEVLSFQNGVNADKEAYGTGIPFVNISEVIANSCLTVDQIPGMVSLSPQIIKSFKVEFGDVLFNRTSETLEEVGLASVYLDNADVVFGGFVIRGKPNKDHLDPIFCSYLLRSPAIHSQISSKGQGVVRANIGQKELSKVKIFIPSKSEQEAIAHALSDIGALIESLDRLRTKKRQIKQGAMQELLRSKDGWEKKYIGDVLTISHGRSQHEVIDENGAYPVLASGGEIGRAKKYLYNKPSVLIGRKGTIDKPQYMDQPFWTVDTLFYSVVHEPNDAKYIFYQFCLIPWREYNEASGVPSLNARTIHSIEITLPPPEEQIAIATILSDMDAEIDSIEAKLTKTRQIKQGMMHELLTGRIRLI